MDRSESKSVDSNQRWWAFATTTEHDEDDIDDSSAKSKSAEWMVSFVIDDWKENGQSDDDEAEQLIDSAARRPNQNGLLCLPRQSS